MGLIKYIKSFYWSDIYDKPTLTPHSFTPLPRYKLNQLIRDIEPNNDDKEPNKNIWEFKKWFRKIDERVSVSKIKI